MIRTTLPLIAGALMSFPATTPVHAAEPELKARIVVEDAPDASKQFVGYVTAQQPFEGRYELTGEKKGVAGNARVKQAGVVKAAPHQATRLSHLAFGSIAADDHYTIQLKIYRGKDLVAQDQIVK